MLQFSDQLKIFVKERKIKIYVLAQISGIDRTLIQKMLKGERLPAEQAIVQELARSLLLTPQETEVLLQSYYVSKMGKDTYVRRKYAKDFFNHFDNCAQESKLHIDVSCTQPDGNLPDDNVIYGRHNIHSVLSKLIPLEASKGDGRIRIIAQPDFSFLLECVTLSAMNWGGLSVEHIICLENFEEGKNSHYNLDCISAVMPLLVSGCDYRPLCYYDNVSSHFSSTDIMPYMVLTGDYIINISYDISYATVSRCRTYVELYNRIFEDIAQKSLPMARVLHSGAGHIAHYIHSVSEYGNIDYSFNSDPYLVYFATEEMCRKYVRKDLQEKDDIVPLIMEYIRRMEKTLTDGNAATLYFSEEGLDRFLQTGRLTRIPQQFYNPFDPADRYRLLKSMYNAALSGAYRPLLVDSRKLMIPPNLSTSTCGSHTTVFVYAHQKRDYSAFIVTEKSIADELHDFLDYLKDSNMVFSPDETMALIRDRLNRAPDF